MLDAPVNVGVTMKRRVAVVVLLAVSAVSQAQVLIQCGRSLNFQHEYELYTKDYFSTRNGEWTLTNYGKRIASGGSEQSTAKAVEKDGVFGAYLVTQKQGGQTVQYAFVNFAACYEEGDAPVKLQVKRDTGDGTGPKVIRATSCDCKMFQ